MVTYRIILFCYLVFMFTTLPFLPIVNTALTALIGEHAVNGILSALLLFFAGIPLFWFLAPPRPRSFLPILYLFLVPCPVFLLSLPLASSPIGRIHLVEYALLALLITRSFPVNSSESVRYGGAILLATLIGIVDESVQHILPNRVFDWYDIAINASAAVLGSVTAGWFAMAKASKETFQKS